MKDVVFIGVVINRVLFYVTKRFQRITCLSVYKNSREDTNKDRTIKESTTKEKLKIKINHSTIKYLKLTKQSGSTHEVMSQSSAASGEVKYQEIRKNNDQNR